MPSDTPRTDEVMRPVWDGQNFDAVPVYFSRQLERKLAAAIGLLVEVHNNLEPDDRNQEEFRKGIEIMRKLDAFLAEHHHA